MENLFKQAGNLVNDQRMALAETIVAMQYERQPGAWERYGEKGRQISIRDQAYHLQFLAEALIAQDSSLFTDYVNWARELFAGLRLPEAAMEVALECTREALRHALPPEYAAAADPFLVAALEAMQREAPLTDNYLDEAHPLAALAHEYIDALLQGDRHQASRLVLDAVEQGTAVKDIYLNIFQPAQYEVGRLWMTNRISVAQEHFCTAATQLIMSQLYPRIFSSQRIGRQFMATCVGGELHEIGVRMVADFFEMEGWDTYYLGANSPTETVVRTVEERRPDVLGISATMTFHLRLVEDLIARVRRRDPDNGILILVGGYPFTRHPDLWKQVGADGCSYDARGAVEVAHSLL